MDPDTGTRLMMLFNGVVKEGCHGSNRERLLLSEEVVLLSDLVRVEFTSALARWVRMKEIEEPHAQRISRKFDEDIRENRFTRCCNSPEQVDLALQWLLARTTALRTLDALPLP